MRGSRGRTSTPLSASTRADSVDLLPDPDKNTVELFYDTSYTEEQIVEWYGGGESYASDS